MSPVRDTILVEEIGLGPGYSAGKVALMSTISTIHVPDQPAAPLPDDPFRYGWRYVRVQRSDGTETFDQIPLTLEDVLHPETGDFIVQTDPHDDDTAYLKSVFKSRLADNPRAAVVADCRIDWKLPGVRPLGPDVAVFLDVIHHRLWATLDVVAEGVRTALVVEVTSPSTRINDVETKFDFYHRARVPWYIIADARIETPEDRRLELLAYQYTPQGYERIGPDPKGRVWLAPVALWLGVSRNTVAGGERLACFDPVTGEEIGDYTAVTRAAALAKDRADAEKNRADAEKDRADAEKDRADSEVVRADIEASARAAAEARADAEAARAAAEALARSDAEARAAALESRIRELESQQKPQG
jgi:colicin import membrane protein